MEITNQKSIKDKKEFKYNTKDSQITRKQKKGKKDLQKQIQNS